MNHYIDSTKDKGKEDIPALPEAYHKARKQYGFFSALLMAWELIGIKVVQGKALMFFNIEFERFHLMPLVLLSLIVYFGFRITIEWMQADVMRTKEKLTQMDFWVSHLIAASSVGILIISELRIAQKIKNSANSVWEILIAFTIGLIIAFLFAKLLESLKTLQMKYRVAGIILSAVILLVGLAGALWVLSNWGILTVVTLLSFFLGALIATGKILFSKMVQSEK